MDLISLGIISFIFFYVVIPGLFILAAVVFYILLAPFMVIAGIVMEIDKVLHSQKNSAKADIFIENVSSIEGKDPLFEEAIQLVCQHDKASASLLQRRLSVGYARAARILDQLEESGIIGPGEGSKPRDVLVKNADEFMSQLDKKFNKKKISL